MPDCGCKPGTELNGWHEIRCAECLDKERKAFGKAFDIARKIVKK